VFAELGRDTLCGGGIKGKHKGVLFKAVLRSGPEAKLALDQFIALVNQNLPQLKQMRGTVDHVEASSVSRLWNQGPQEFPCAPSDLKVKPGVCKQCRVAHEKTSKRDSSHANSDLESPTKRARGGTSAGGADLAGTTPRAMRTSGGGQGTVGEVVDLSVRRLSLASPARGSASTAAASGGGSPSRARNPTR